MRIIFNADDFGLSKGVNYGIIEAYLNGVVRSTTMMAGMPGFDHAFEMAARYEGLKVGVHLTLTAGNSIGGVYETITDGSGAFFKLGAFEEKARSLAIDAGEVEAEFDAQIRKIIEAGIVPDHFDSHHHVHNLPCVADVYLKLAKKYGVKARRCNAPHGGVATGDSHCGVETTDLFSDAFYNDAATLDGLKSILLPYCSGGGDNSSRSGSSDYRNAGCASFEIMSHPAFVDYDLHNSSSYCIKRIHELHILTCDALKVFLSTNGFEICSFSDL
jgi:predicted glycoside hydrolase/deacetylase ChbG (UPF0249 family)